MNVQEVQISRLFEDFVREDFCFVLFFSEWCHALGKVMDGFLKGFVVCCEDLFVLYGYAMLIH